MKKLLSIDADKMPKEMRAALAVALRIARDESLSGFDELEPHERMPTLRAVELIEKMIEAVGEPAF